MPVSHSSTVEDYVITIYRMWANGEPVLGARVAEHIGVAPATVTEMVARLRSQGLLSAGRTIELSPTGLRLARALASRHRLAERFLVDVLGFGWDEVHEEAHRLEHALSPRVTERLAALLGHPATCPHGHPIMEEGNAEPDLHLQPLTALAPGTAGTVRRIAHEEPELLGLLTSLGIGLGTEIRVAGRGRDAGTTGVGSLSLDVAGKPQVIDFETASAVLVEPS
jgi:DtxR family Mn-dependent transcriptional regulator